MRHRRSFGCTSTNGADEVLVHLAVDAAPGLPPSMTGAGPTLDPVEPAGRKLIALFDRADRATSPTSTCWLSGFPGQLPWFQVG